MTAALKYVTVVLSVLIGVEMATLGNLVSADQSEAVAKDVDEAITLSVSDTLYTPPVEEVVEEAVETEEVEEWESDDVDYNYDDFIYVVYSDYGYDDDVSLVPYDGGGYYDANLSGAQISGSDLMYYGRMYDDSGYSYTYYSQNVLPGGGLDIPGRHVNDEGYVCDGDGNICVASDDLPYGTVVNVPFGDGTAVVYDSGSGHGNLDVYTSW